MKTVNANTLYGTGALSKAQIDVRQAAVNNFEAFIRLMAPYQMLAHCHIVMAKWVQEKDDENKLLLWPRDHGKSRYCAFYTAWQIIRDPATTIIYASATAEKAEEQLRFIKSIIDSKIARRYFPELLLAEEGRREAWNKTYIIVDHPIRKTEGVVDSTVMTCGLEKTITGKHCKRLILDDVVVPENNTETGRKDVNSWVAQAASITSADSSIFAVGTRYHPKDAYQTMMDMVYEEDVEDEDGEIISEARELFNIMIDNVEEDGDFLWPRQQRKDGKWFGFNKTILARKRSVYEANHQITQFFAQYYNDPNDKTTAPISRELFKYYSKSDCVYSNGLWEINGVPCHVFAACDMASTVADSSDYTVVIVGAIDIHNNRYILDINRFRSDKISEIDRAIKASYERFRFKQLRIEAVSGFRLVAQDLADRLYDAGIRIPIDIYVPPNNIAKAVRVNGILEPLYQSGAVYHYRSGNCQILEDELVSVSPQHDDTKDAWAMCVDIMKLPLRRRPRQNRNVVSFNRRFGGVAA